VNVLSLVTQTFDAEYKRGPNISQYCGIPLRFAETLQRCHSQRGEEKEQKGIAELEAMSDEVQTSDRFEPAQGA